MGNIAATLAWALVIAFLLFACVVFICCGFVVIKITKEFWEEDQ